MSLMLPSNGFTAADMPTRLTFGLDAYNEAVSTEL